MSWLLDTDACSHALRDRFGVRDALRSRAPVRVHVSTITIAEAWAGSIRSPHKDRLLELWSAFLEPFEGRTLPFDDDAAREYGAIRAHLEARGEMIGDRDCMIAAIARARRLTLVSGNLHEFRRVPGLDVEDWARADAGAHRRSPDRSPPRS